MISRILTFAAVTLIASTTYAGGVCRSNNFTNIGNLAVVQPDYYYAVTPQIRAPFVYQGDVDSLLQARRELLRLSQGLNTADIQAQTQLQSLPVVQPQRLDSGSHCNGKCDCGKCPPSCKNCQRIPDPEPTPDPAPDGQPSDLDAKAADVLKRYNCTGCHGKAKPDGNFRISIGGGVVDLSRGDRFEIHGKSAHNEMPPAGKGNPLTPEDLDILYKWANSKGR